jgi:hypothetical protein
MAEVKNEKQTSLFQVASVTAPIAIGGGIGVSRLSKQSSFFAQPVNQLPNNPANDAIRQFANRYVNPQRSGVFKEWQLEKVASLAEKTPLTADQTRNSIMRAASIADPTGAVGNMFINRLKGGNTGTEVLRDLYKVLSSSNSIYTQRAASIFLDDIGVLSNRVNSGFSIEPQKLYGRVPIRSESITLESLKPGMQQDIKNIAQQLGASFSMTERSRSDDIAGSELHIRFSRSKKFKGNFVLRVPRPLQGQESLVVRGTTQQSKYIAGMYGILEDGVLKESFNHEEWTLRRASEDLVPKITRGKVLEQRKIKALVNEFSTKMMETPELVPSLPYGEHAGIDEYINQRSNIIRMHTTADTGGVRPINEFEYYRLMERGGADLPEGGIKPLFPGFAPTQIAKGVVSTKDVRDAMSLVPEAVPYGRRPLQFIRAGSEPLNPNLIAADPVTQNFSWAKSKAGIDAPMLRAAYVSGELSPQFAGTGVTTEGQMLIAQRLDKLRAVNKIKQFDIASDQMVDLKDLIDQDKGASWSINQKLSKGAFLGYSPEGRPVTLPEDMTIVNATAFAKDKNKGDFIRVMAKQNISEMLYSKVFGGAKGMAVTTSTFEMQKLLKERAGVTWLNNSSEAAIDALITMDELKKNRGLHYNQMFTSMWEFTKENIDSGKTQSTISSNFANDPTKLINKMRADALKNDKFSHEVMLDQIKTLARESNLNPQQMGRVFGAVPDVFGDISALGALSAAEKSEISKGIATGATQLFFEDLGGPGSGKTATIEPRAFELLGAPHFGALGAELQKDVAYRMIASQPQRLMEQKELSDALETVANLKQRQGGMSPKTLLNEMGVDKLIPNEPSWLKIDGMGDVYIPSGSKISQLAAHKTAKGMATESTLALAYANTIEAANEYSSGNITKSDMLSELASLKNELVKSKVATVTGAGGLMRGRLPGSTFLTAVQPTANTQLSPNAVGLPSSMAKKMFEEMRQLPDVYNKADIDFMEKTFMSGGKISGILGRHPYIGPYSSQAVQFQKVAGDSPVAVVNEKMQRAIAIKGKLEGESLEKFKTGAANALRGDQKSLARMNQIGAEMMGSPIRLSPFVGLAGDFDGDVISAMFAGPQLQKLLTSHMFDQSTLDAYEEYSIRSQVLKAKGKGDAITLRKTMAGDVMKLGITQTGTLGNLSNQLQQYKAAVLYGGSGLSNVEQTNALGLLEWMENTPISGKHIAPGKEQQMIGLIQDMQVSLDKKNANGIAEAARTVLAKAKMSGQSALNEGMTIALEDFDTGKVTTRYTPGLDIDKASQNIVHAFQSFEASSIGRASAAEIRKLIMNKGGLSSGNEAASVLKKMYALEQTPFGGFFGAENALKIDQIMDRVGSFVNRAKSAGRGLMLLAKPLALGGAAALGLATVLSSPPKFTPQGSNVPSLANMQAGTGGGDLGYGEHPHQRQMGNPTAANPVQSGHSARLMPDDQSGYRVNIQGATSHHLDAASLNNQIRQSVGGRAQVNSSVCDLRSSLTSQRLSSIIQDE